ncbi:MAG: NAD(P)-dependent dehydrogenase (short-subunit alcohol dehydrogenase family) [Glaciecola sp.]
MGEQQLQLDGVGDPIDRQLAGRLPDGVTVNAVSPGNTPDTNATNRAPALIRRVMVPVMKLITGMSHAIPVLSSPERPLGIRNDCADARQRSGANRH